MDYRERLFNLNYPDLWTKTEKNEYKIKANRKEKTDRKSAFILWDPITAVARFRPIGLYLIVPYWFVPLGDPGTRPVPVHLYDTFFQSSDPREIRRLLNCSGMGFFYNFATKYKQMQTFEFPT